MRINWEALIEDANHDLIKDWSVGDLSSREVTESLSFTGFAGEFRKVLRTHGTLYGRRLARKALNRRGVIV